MPIAPDHRETAIRDLAPLLAALRTLPDLEALGADALEPAGFTGMAHDHIRIKGRGLVLRVPRVSQWGLAAIVNLAYQTACFRRAYPSGNTPTLHAVLPPSADLPMGALLVEEIEGRKPRLPRDLAAIAAAIRAVHGLPLLRIEERRPLLSPANSLAEMLKTIELQAAFLDWAGLHREASAQLREELAWARHFVAEHAPPSELTSLILTDSHPGNFVIHSSGRAYFVDLEKAMYGLPAIDLAHATLYTSTRFDPDIDATLTEEETAAFYRDYLAGIEPERAARLQPWLAPLRRLVWLRTMTWCVKWAVESRGTGGWSRRRLDARTRGHMEACLKDFFDPATIARLRGEWSGGRIVEYGA
jgi:Phosphotransferase enzyme family